MTTLVRLSERSAADNAFRIRVEFPDAEYDVVVTDPADEASEQELAWYFEEHLRYPFLDKDREREAVERISAYGAALFGQVFGGKASHSYLQLREQSFDGCRLEISGSAALHRLHWEALRDPEHPESPLAVRLPITRRVEAQPAQFAVRGDLPTLNILVVTARPGGPHDVGYRTISRPLLDALRNADQPVTVDLVRPGTWEALRAHLAEATRRHQSGWYQVIHFDLHGAFTGYDALAQGAGGGKLLFSPAALPPFDGQRGFLFFETERDDVAHPVPAEAVASLLDEHRIPVAVLNACQSAMQTVSEAGLAQRLAEAGVPVTVGMAYSVTVTAAERSMPVLYEQLAAGADPVTAVRAARRELFEHRGRRAYFDQQLDLEDWMLPVVFGQRPLQVRLRAMTDAEQAEFFERSADVGDEPAIEYGFVGRDLDIQAIERRLLTGRDSNELLVRGMAGAGKSTLLTHLGWWWQRTGLVGQVFRFSYEDRAWTAHQIVRGIRAKLFTPAEHAAADSRSEAAQLEQVAQRLRAQRHLLILDNAESITLAPAAIPHALSAEEQGKLKTLLSRLRGGRTLVLLGSREPESWLTSDSAGPGSYPLPGLDPQASSVLVDRILARHGATRHLGNLAERLALEDLVKLLGGYPLPLTVVLPVLATSKPSAVLAELREGGPGADPTGLIHRAIEYSHGKLDESLQNSLLLLAPFTSVIPVGPILERYQELLLQDEAVQGLGEISLAVALDRAVRVGLAAPHPQVGYLLQVQPVLPYFLRSRLQDRPALRSASAEAHYQLYRDVSGSLYNLLKSAADPRERGIGRAATLAEYANLTAAVAYGERTRQPITAIVGALEECLDQGEQHDTRQRFLEETISDYPEPDTEMQRRELAFLHNLAGDVAYDQHRLDDAKAHHEAELGLLQAVGDMKRQGLSYGQLAHIAWRRERLDEAESYYRQALEIFLEFDDEHAGEAYHDLGKLAHARHRYDEAKSYYDNALRIKLAHGNEHGAANTYLNLGFLAAQQKLFDEAAANTRMALDIYLKFGDMHSVAECYRQFGDLAQAQKSYAEAEKNYRQALDGFLSFGDRFNAATAHQELGSLALMRGRVDEAVANYQKAVDVYQEFGYRKAAFATAAELGVIEAGFGRHAEASRILLRAATGWRQEEGRWARSHLQWLHLERGQLEEDEFAALVRDQVPAELIAELTAAIDATGDPTTGGNAGDDGPADNG